MTSSFSPPSQTKLISVLLLVSSGVSIALFTPITQITQHAGLRAEVGVLPFTVAVLIVHYVLFRRTVQQFKQIAIALHTLTQGRKTAPLEAHSGDFLAPVIQPLNALIHERADMLAMRGRLFEQISEAAAQEERNRLARDLHDSIKQQVFSMSISAAAAHAHLDSNPSAARAALADVKQSAQEAMVEMRALLQQLSPAPLEKSGLVQALREQCEALAYRTGAKVVTHFGNLPDDTQLPVGTQETLFRIAQEALSNIARHARAQTVTLSLGEEEKALVLQIVDNGQGFDMHAPPSGMGLSNIRARVASLSGQIGLSSQQGEGTTILISIPLVQPIPTEEIMYVQHQAKLKPIINLYLGFGLSIAAFVTAFSLFSWRLLMRPEGILEDTFLTIIFATLIVVMLFTLPYASRTFLKARAQTSDLLALAGDEGRISRKLWRHAHMAYLIISLALAWFAPIFAIALNVNEWLRVGIGVIFLGVVGWHYLHMAQFYHEELMLIPLQERLAEIKHALQR